MANIRRVTDLPSSGRQLWVVVAQLFHQAPSQDQDSLVVEEGRRLQAGKGRALAHLDHSAYLCPGRWGTSSYCRAPWHCSAHLVVSWQLVDVAVVCRPLMLTVGPLTRPKWLVGAVAGKKA